MLELRGKERESVILGALLHDIGKFLHKSTYFIENFYKNSEEYKKYSSFKHPFVSAYFIDFLEKYKIISGGEILKQLVRCHHESHFYKGTGMHVDDIEDLKIRNLAYLVSSADTFSSKERRDEGQKDLTYKEKLLDNIFSHVNIEKKSSQKQMHQYKTLELENIFTNEKIKQANVVSQNNLIEGFFQDILNLANNDDFDTLIANMLDVFQKYLTFVPSDTTKVISDVSLYDHLKASAALATASYDYHLFNNNIEKKEVSNSKEKRFVLVSGTVEGIQRYIYSIGSDKAAAKKLRAKSFYLSMFTDVVAKRILDELNLNSLNLILSAGSKFTIVGPNTPRAIEKLNEIKNELEEYMYEEFKGELFVNIDYVSASGENTINFHESIKDINDRLEENKGNRFKDYIIKNPVFNENQENSRLCPECMKNGIEIREGKEVNSICKFCEMENSIGRLLPKISYIAISKGKSKGENVINFFKDSIYSCHLVESLEKVNSKKEDIKAVYVINESINEKSLDRSYPIQKKYLGNYVAKASDNEVKTFSDIVKSSKGVNNLAVLKMDVDNLGAIFYQGLVPDDEKEKNYTSVSRISTMSRMFETFFAGYLSYYFKEVGKYNHINSLDEVESDFSNNYVVYAGGDDLLVIGPWNEIIYTAKFIKDKFSEFTSYNEDLTISGGIAIGKPSSPIRHLILKADEALEESKLKGKNRLTVFGKAIKWEDFEAVFEFGEYFYKNLGSNYNQSFAYRLLSYVNMMELYVKTENPVNLMYLSKFSYDLERNIISKVAKSLRLDATKETDRAKIFQREEVKRLVNVFNNPETGGIPDEGDFGYEYMRVVLNYAIMKNRKVGGE